MSEHPGGGRSGPNTRAAATLVKSSSMPMMPHRLLGDLERLEEREDRRDHVEGARRPAARSAWLQGRSAGFTRRARATPPAGWRPRGRGRGRPGSRRAATGSSAWPRRVPPTRPAAGCARCSSGVAYSPYCGQAGRSSPTSLALRDPHQRRSSRLPPRHLWRSSPPRREHARSLPRPCADLVDVAVPHRRALRAPRCTENLRDRRARGEADGLDAVEPRLADLGPA